MREIFSKEKWGIYLFVFFSLAVVLALFSVITWPDFMAFRSGLGHLSDNNGGQFQVNEVDFFDDLLVTKNQKIEDLLATPIISGVDPKIGSLAAPVKIVYFADFKCQICAAQEAMIARVLKKYGEQTLFVWKDMPETDESSMSFQAAIAGRCADAQKRFWDFHDALYQKKEFDGADFAEIANNLKMDVPVFVECLQGKKTKPLVVDNLKEAGALDISGIPFMYINRQTVFGEISEMDLVRMIDLELQKALQAPKNDSN